MIKLRLMFFSRKGAKLRLNDHARLDTFSRTLYLNIRTILSLFSLPHFSFSYLNSIFTIRFYKKIKQNIFSQKNIKQNIFYILSVGKMSFPILFNYEINNVNIYTTKKNFSENITGQNIADMVANDIETTPALFNTKLKRLFYHDIEFNMDVDISMNDQFTDKIKLTILLEKVKEIIIYCNLSKVLCCLIDFSFILRSKKQRTK